MPAPGRTTVSLPPPGRTNEPNPTTVLALTHRLKRAVAAAAPPAAPLAPNRTTT
jgi:hypothetical protein